MTMTGKILVFLNLLFSFFFMAFAMSVYATRTDLRGQMAKLRKDVQDANSKASSADTEKGASDAKLKAKDDELAEAKKAYEKDIKQVTKERDDYFNDLKALRTDTESKIAIFNQATLEQSVRKKELADVRAAHGELVRGNAKLVTEKGELQDQLSQTKNQLESSIDRNKQIDERLKQLEAFVLRKMEKLPDDIELASAQEGPAPPPEVEGIVKSVDETGKFIEISLGEDHGIRKAHILEVWRAKPEPKYLGKVRVFTTTATTAVVKPVSVSGRIQENDTVGTRVISRLNGN